MPPAAEHYVPVNPRAVGEPEVFARFGAKLIHNSQERIAAKDALVKRLDARLREWKPETAAQVRERVAEVIELAGHDVLDPMRPRAAEQEVLDP